jgi:TP901 family phage tail tape measure protein
MMRFGSLVTAPFVIGAKVAADFETSMAKIQTLIGDTGNAMEMFGGEVREMSKEFGKPADELAAGLYEILSASVPASKAMKVLEVANKAAVGGFTDVKTAADALTTVMNAYGMSADSAASVADVLLQVQQKGKTEFGKIAPVIGRVASIAASSGVRFEELAAFMANLTRNGISTEEAVTSLRAAIATFLKPTEGAIKALKGMQDQGQALGVDLSTAGIKANGFAGTLESISKLPPDMVSKLFPNVQALAGLAPIFNDFAAFRGDIDAMTSSAGANEKAFRTMAETTTFKFNKLKEQVLDAFREIGVVILPTIRDVVKEMTPIVGSIGKWISKNEDLIKVLGGVGLAITSIGAVVVGLGSAIQVVGFAMSGFGIAAAALSGGVLLPLLGTIGLVTAAIVGLTLAFSDAENEVPEKVSGGLANAGVNSGLTYEQRTSREGVLKEGAFAEYEVAKTKVVMEQAAQREQLIKNESEKIKGIEEDLAKFTENMRQRRAQAMDDRQVRQQIAEDPAAAVDSLFRRLLDAGAAAKEAREDAVKAIDDAKKSQGELSDQEIKALVERVKKEEDSIERINRLRLQAQDALKRKQETDANNAASAARKASDAIRARAEMASTMGSFGGLDARVFSAFGVGKEEDKSLKATEKIAMNTSESLDQMKKLNRKATPLVFGGKGT